MHSTFSRRISGELGFNDDFQAIPVTPVVTPVKSPVQPIIEIPGLTRAGARFQLGLVRKQCARLLKAKGSDNRATRRAKARHIKLRDC